MLFQENIKNIFFFQNIYLFIKENREMQILKTVTSNKYNIVFNQMFTKLNVIILLLKQPYMSSQSQRAASDYAKARVDQIRKKFGYSNNKQNNFTRTTEPTASKFKEDTPKKYIPAGSALQNLPAVQTKIDKDFQEYYDRIKNIDSLNRKIFQILQSKQSSTKKQQLRADDKKQQTRRRASVPVAQQPVRPIQKTQLRIIDTNGITSMKRKAQLSEISSFAQNVIKEAQNRQEKRQEKKHLGLYIPNSKYTVSMELPTSPKKSEKQAKPSMEVTKQGEKITNSKLRERTNDKQYNTCSKKESAKLAQKLSQQISKDQNLRFLKWEFSEWSKQNKWELLRQQFNKRATIEEVTRLFSLNPEQHNPFFELKQPTTQSCVQNLIRSYNQTNSFWNESVKQSCSISELEKQSFNLKDLDLNKKGYLSVEDIVCFVNLYTGKFFRNRDAIGLIKRFSDGSSYCDGIKYESFLDKVTKC